MKAKTVFIFLGFLCLASCSFGKRLIMKNDYNRILMEKCAIEHGILTIAGLTIEPVGGAPISNWAEVSIYVSNGPVEPGKEGSMLVYKKRIEVAPPGKGRSICFPDVSTQIEIKKGWTHGAMVIKWDVSGFPNMLQIPIWVR